MAQLQPLRDLIHVQLEEKSDRTASGLYVKEGWDTPPNTGIIKAIGPEVTKFAVGERVLFNPYALLPVTVDNDKVYFIKADDLIGSFGE